MNEVERQLREMFERRALDVLDAAPPAAPVVRRTRGRQAATVAVVSIVVAAVVLVPVVGTWLGHRTSRPVLPTVTVELPHAPAGFRVAALPYASIAYPEGWYLLDTSISQSTTGPSPAAPVPGPVLQLANFDPDVPHSPRCIADPDSIPDEGVLLTVGIAAQGEPPLGTPGDWPAPLEPYPPNVDPVCAQMREQATWRAPSGLTYWASAGWSRSASQADIDAVHRAFDSLRLPPTSQPWMSPMGDVRERATPRVVLDSTTHGDDVLTFVAYLQLDRVLWVGVQSNGPWNGATAPHTGSVPDEPVQAGLSIIGEDAALFDGVVSPEVSRIEVRTQSGDAVPMHIDPLPASLGTDRFVWALVPGASDRSTVVGYDRNGDPIGSPVYPVGGDQTVARGTEAGKTWTLSLTHDNVGWGLSFAWEGEGSGGGSGGDLGDKVFGGMGSGGPSWSIDTGWSTTPREIEGVVTSSADAVELRLVDGDPVRGSVYPLPPAAFGGGASAFVLFIPNDVLVQAGDVLAYDARGEILGRQYVDFSPVSLFPAVLEKSSPDAIQAMKALQLAGAVAARYFYDHDSWQGFDPAAASAISDAVSYNSSSTAVVGEVSLRLGSKNSMVLATRTASGEVYSACLEDGPGPATEGRNDTSDPSACSNGWLHAP